MQLSKHLPIIYFSPDGIFLPTLIFLVCCGDSQQCCHQFSSCHTLSQAGPWGPALPIPSTSPLAEEMQEIQPPAQQEGISIQSIIHSAFSMYCTCPFLPLERKLNNYTACKKHALWLTFMIKLWSCCNEIFRQYIKTKQNQRGNKKLLLSLFHPWFSFVWFI